MRKFTYKDVYDWKVTDINGKRLFLTVREKDGTEKRISRFDGYRSANHAAKILGGRPMRV